MTTPDSNTLRALDFDVVGETGADLFNRACFNYPTLGDLYKYATYDALLQRTKLGRVPA